MEPIEKIKAEIERRIKEIDKIGTYLSPKGVLTNFLCYIDTLEVKEKNEGIKSSDLEEAAWTYYDKNKPLIPHELDLHKEIISFFIAGAQWQKQQDQSTIELAEDHAYLAGQEKTFNKAYEWVKYNNENGGCLFDGWEDDFKKAIEE